MAKKQAPAKKRNPQDATMRNIRALKWRVSRLEAIIRAIQRQRGTRPAWS